MRRIQKVISIIVIGFIFLIYFPNVPASAQTRKKTKKVETTIGKGNSSKKKTTSINTKAGTNTRKKTTGTNKKAAPVGSRKETPEQMRRRQQEMQREIARTKEQIRKNETEMKRGLNNLGKLQTDIKAGEKLVADARGKVEALQKQIDVLNSDISRNESELERLRAEYLKAVKKIRANRKTNSDLAFLFSSKDFNQAMRRMRYLKQFSDWREKRSMEIESRVSEMKKQQSLLAQARVEKDAALQTQEKAQNILVSQYNQQDVMVKELKKNGKALNAHLANKQKEANALNGRIAALIAEEQRKAEAERRAKEAEEARLRAEAEKKAEESNSKIGEEIAQNVEKKDAKSQTSDKQKVDKKSSGESTSKSKDYALARRRRPRSESSTESSVKGASSSGNASSKTATSKSAAVSGSFADMRGSLPRPVSGSFSVTSRFGPNSLPDLPDVVYDNPGIDAETSPGASALAVYKGKVSGVYVVPGYSTVIIVNHGGYYTVYGNIESPSVKVGDTVSQGQSLGKVAFQDGDESHGSIHFEVWKNREKMNPLDWIK